MRTKSLDHLKFVSLRNSKGEEIDRLPVASFADRSIEPSIYKSLHMNSYAREDIFGKLTNETLIEATNEYLEQCFKPPMPCSTYEEAIVHKIVPELLKRLDEEMKKNQTQNL